MSVVVYLENWDGKFKKNTWEAASYAAQTAKMLDTDAIGVSIGDPSEDLSQGGKYGLKKIIEVKDDALSQFDANAYGKALATVADQEGASVVIVSGTSNGKAMAPALSIYAEAGLLSNVTQLPLSTDPLTVKRGVFSSKGFNELSSTTEKTVIEFVPNSISAEEKGGEAEMTSADAQVGDTPRVKVEEVDRVKGQIPLPEAERVVSGGRGLKGPDNWNIIEELADALDAGTACSKPVSDMDWRPHSEHVGQTGITIKPDLYVAIGISGAIQHLAGVSASKTIVAINNDPEAPFFKAADYGVVGDAFEVVPRLTEAVKEFKAQN